jgi:hypothetical protein
MSEKSDKKLIKLRIARAYIELLCTPDDGSALRAISLARIGDHEIRLFEHPQTERADAPLFWMELIDHRMPEAINSCTCDEIEDAVNVFEEFLADAERLEAARRQADKEPQG